jgi:hypothetical protein
VFIDPASTLAVPSKALVGWVVTTLTTPPMAWLPHRVDWAPRSTSMRAMSPPTRLAKL